MTDEPLLRRLALSIVRQAMADPRLAQLSTEDWDALDTILARHRLQPLVHAQHGSVAPPVIAARWAAAHRSCAISALRQRAALLHANRVLDNAGIRAVALKGAWLAWHAYDAPALRPMRDIDLLVAPDCLRQAWQVLGAAGHRPLLDIPDWSLAERDKHLPPLLSPEGVVIELHGRAWESEEQAGHAMPAGSDGILARAQTCSPKDNVVYPQPQDTLAHLVIHAVYSHWLDCGPLVLADIDVLVRKAAPPWPAFWARAHAEGWERGAALVLALVDRWRRPGVLAASGCPLAVPEELMEAAPDLLLQSAEKRAEARIVSRLGRDGIGALVQAKWLEARSHPAHFARNFLRRSTRLLAGAASGEARRKARVMDRLGSWLLAD